MEIVNDRINYLDYSKDNLYSNFQDFEDSQVVVKQIEIKRPTFHSAIADVIHKEICEYWRNNGKEPKAILLNPQDFYKFISEVPAYLNIRSSISGDYKYEGMLMYSSPQVLHLEVIVLGK